MEPSKQCSYIGCKRVWKRGEQFHYIPVHNSGLCVKWLINSGREDLLTHTSAKLKSMKLLICSQHFHKSNYQNGVLKDNSLPVQYWDTGYDYKSDEINEDCTGTLPVKEEDIGSSAESDDCDSLFEGTDDEFRTELGNKIEVLLNTVMCGRSKNQKKTDIGKSLKNFYKDLNLRSDGKNKMNVLMSGNIVAFKQAIKGTCRTCAKKKPNLIQMTDKSVHSKVSILTKLKLLIEFEDPDVLPKEICEDCIAKLNHSYDFFQQIYKADSTLKGILYDQVSSKKTVADRGNYNGHSSNKSNVNGGSISIKEESTNLASNMDENPMVALETHPGNSQEKSNECTVKQEIVSPDENDRYTVSYLLSESCSNDAELNWSDVIEAMKQKDDSIGTKSPQSDTNMDPVQVSCKYCDSSFRLRRQLKSHLLTHHKKPLYKSPERHCHVNSKQEYACNECSAMFPKKMLLRSHMKQAHNSKEIAKLSVTKVSQAGSEAIPFSKSTTADNSGSNDTSDKVKGAISNVEEIYSCDECTKTFTVKRALLNHIHRLHPPFAYTCSICKKILYSESDTYEHMKEHDNAPLFPCVKCGKMFYSSQRLQKHMILHSKNKIKQRKKVWFNCKLCDASYQASDELIKHIRGHSLEDWQKYRNNILYCGECNARLFGHEQFFIHKMRYHLAKRSDFVCLLCEVAEGTFKSLDDYEEHIDLHSTKLKRLVPQRFACEYCNKAFKTNSYLLNHINSFHAKVVRSRPKHDLEVQRRRKAKEPINQVHSSEKQQRSKKISTK